MEHDTNRIRRRVLLDACIDRRLKKSIIGHDVWTARDKRINELPDGELLDAIDGKFDVLITQDKSLPHQNRVAGRSFGVVLLRARSNRIVDLLPLVPAMMRAIADVKPGEVLDVIKP
jgi:predicted nuclease of predicted toxin-antitoxin system